MKTGLFPILALGCVAALLNVRGQSYAMERFTANAGGGKSSNGVK